MDNLNIVDVFRKALQGLQDTTDELETAVKNWKGNEKALTRALAEAMQKCEMNREMHSLYELHVDGVGCGYMDNLLASRDDCTPVALFEFGLSRQEHWQKINQDDLYLNGLESASKSAASPKKRKQSTDNKVRPSCFGDKPVLLTTVTYEKESKDCKISVFFCWRKAYAQLQCTCTGRAVGEYCRCRSLLAIVAHGRVQLTHLQGAKPSLLQSQAQTRKFLSLICRLSISWGNLLHTSLVESSNSG
jgi:hypothetical protein